MREKGGIRLLSKKPETEDFGSPDYTVDNSYSTPIPETVQEKPKNESFFARMSKKSSPMKELNDRPIDPEIVELVLSQKRTSNLKSINEMNGIAEKVTMQTLDLEKYVNKIKTDYNANEIIFKGGYHQFRICLN